MKVIKRTAFTILLIGFGIIGNSQVQIGNDIEGELLNEEFGTTVSVPVGKSLPPSNSSNI